MTGSLEIGRGGDDLQILRRWLDFQGPPPGVVSLHIKKLPV